MKQFQGGRFHYFFAIKEVHYEAMSMKASILRLFEESNQPLKRKAIQRYLKTDATKKQVKEALRCLAKEGAIVRVKGGNKSYTLTHMGGNIHGDSGDVSKPVPIAELLRRRKEQPVSVPKPQEEPRDHEEEVSDLDEEIRRLEAELNNDSAGSDSEDDDDGSDSLVATKGVISLSTVAEDRIKALPQQCLPANKRRIMKGIDGPEGAGSGRKSKRRKEEEAPRNVSEGLKAAVKEVLSGYVPRSNEKLPFYCRVCAKQYEDSDAFFQHKKSDFHKTAVDMEQKASYCKLCRKQLTSPVQLKEHLTSKPHKDRLQQMKSRQLPRRK
jgi:Zinc-finger of C2H2 type